MGKDYFPCYNSYLEKTAKLSDQELGRLFRALMTYSATGEPAQLAGREALAYDFIVYDIDRARDHYQEVSEIRSRARMGKADSDGDRSRQRTSNVTRDNKSLQKEHLITNVTFDNKCGEYEYKDKNENKNEDEDKDEGIISAELPASRASTPDKPSVISLLLTGGEVYGVSEDQVSHWGELYPAVDIMQELRKMAGWLESNPTKRKTRRGVTRFITSWLARTQDRGGANGFAGGGGGYGSYSRQDSAPQSKLEWSGGALADFA